MKQLIRRIKRIRAGTVVWLNVVISLVLIIVFGVSTLTISARLQDENEQRTRRTLNHFREVFEQEITSVRDMMYLCKGDTAFIMTVNSRSAEWESISDYVNRTIQMLFIMQSAYGSIEGAYLYAPSVSRVIGARGSIDTEYFDQMDWVKNRLTASERFADPMTLHEGWNSFKNIAIYAVTVRSGGRLLALVNLGSLAELDTFSALYPGQQMIVLDGEGRYFTSSCTWYDEQLRLADFSGATDGGLFALNGLDHMVRRVDYGGFSYLLITEADIYGRESLRIAFMSISLCATGFLLLILLMLINGAFSHTIRQSLGIRHDGGVSEADQIERMMLENEGYRHEKLEKAMRAMIESTDMELKPGIVRLISESFGSYYALCLAVQGESGAVDAHALEALIQFIGDSVNSCGVLHGRYLVYFLIELQPGIRIEDVVRQYFDALDDDVLVYMGVSGGYVNPGAIQSAMRQAYRRMMCARTPAYGEKYALSSSEDAGEEPLGDVLLEKMSAALEDGDAALAQELLRGMLAERPVRLLELKRLSEKLDALLSRHEGADLAKAEQFYNPAYMLSCYADRLSRVDAAGEDKLAVHDEFHTRVLEYLSTHYVEDLTLESVADRFHITAVHLSRWFKKTNNINFSTYLSALRMTRAKEIMQNDPDMKISDVATRVGILNAATFTRQFKNFTGMTPEQFRRQCVLDPLSAGMAYKTEWERTGGKDHE